MQAGSHVPDQSRVAGGLSSLQGLRSNALCVRRGPSGITSGTKLIWRHFQVIWFILRTSTRSFWKARVEKTHVILCVWCSPTSCWLNRHGTQKYSNNATTTATTTRTSGSHRKEGLRCRPWRVAKSPRARCPFGWFHPGVPVVPSRYIHGNIPPSIRGTSKCHPSSTPSCGGLMIEGGSQQSQICRDLTFLSKYHKIIFSSTTQRFQTQMLASGFKRCSK